MVNDSLKIGDVVEVTTERLAYGGDAVARYEGFAIFVPLAAPGERLRVRIIERKKHFARAVIDRIVEPSSLRREAPCNYFGECGGCQLQHLSYEAQLKSKIGFVRDALDVAGMAGALAALDPARARAMGAAAREAITPFSPQAMAQEFLALYRRLLRR